MTAYALSFVVASLFTLQLLSNLNKLIISKDNFNKTVFKILNWIAEVILFSARDYSQS